MKKTAKRATEPKIIKGKPQLIGGIKYPNAYYKKQKYGYQLYAPDLVGSHGKAFYKVDLGFYQHAKNAIEARRKLKEMMK